MSANNTEIDPEEFDRLARISEKFEEIRTIANESTTIETKTPITPEDLPEELATQPLGELSIRRIAEMEGANIDELPEEILDTPLAELSLGEITEAIEAGDLGGAGQTFIACGSSGCAVYSN